MLQPALNTINMKTNKPTSYKEVLLKLYKSELNKISKTTHKTKYLDVVDVDTVIDILDKCIVKLEKHTT